MNRLRAALLLHPAEVCLTGCLFVVAVVFVLFPTALDHTPAGFETRGPLHHLWHYVLLLGGSGLALGGAICARHPTDHWARARLIGLIGLICALAMNLLGVVAEDLDSDVQVRGIGVALRVAAILFLTLRVRAIVNPPEVRVKVDK